MEDEKQKFTDISTQISILRDRGLIINNEAFARYNLIYYGYYNIINAYKTLYVHKDTNDSEIFNDNITFEQIIALFQLDYELRTDIYKIITDVEIHLKANLAHIIAKHHTHKFIEYINPMCYKNSNPTKETYSLQKVLVELNDAYNLNKDPIKYSREKYGNVPPWILFKGTYFSTVINLVRYLKAKDKDDLVQMYYNIPSQVYGTLCEKDKEFIKKSFLNSLLLLKKFRNYCSHCGRIYNLNGLHQVRKDEINTILKILKRDTFNDNPKTGIDELILALSPMRDDYVRDLKNQFNSSINKHFSKYENDKMLIYGVVGNLIKN